MKLPQLAKCALGVTAATALLAGCNSGTSSQLAPTVGAQGGALKAPAHDAKFAQLTTVVSPKARVRLRQVTGTHAIKPNCCAHAKTLFISDAGTNEIQMFDFPSNTYIGQVAAPPEGFSEPQGMCSDNKGNVYLANTGVSSIDEFSHDGTYVRTLSDAGQYPVGCAFDKSTGNLAVSNITNTGGGTGTIGIFTNASGTPTDFAGGGFQRFYFLAYMGKTGVLYFDGENSSDVLAYGSLSNGTITPIPIIGATLEFPGSVNYSAKTMSMNIGDQDTSVLYQISTTGAITGSTPLTGAIDVVQGTIKGSNFIGPDVENQDVGIYAYPQGGSPKSTLSGYFSEPIGSAISPDIQ
jgi:hypothetical protein